MKSPEPAHAICYDTAIIGGGPAACGLLTNHALNAEYEDFLNRGVVVLESSSKLGGGVLNQYSQLRSNSHGSAFFDAFKDLSLTAHDNSLNKNDVIPMSELYNLQINIGEWHKKKLDEHSISKVMTDVTALSVTEQDNSTYLIRFSSSGAKTQDEIIAKNVCICCGGTPYTPSWLLDANISIETANDYFSGALCPWSDNESKKVAIVGFSHSAFSIGHLWHVNSPNSQVAFVLRNNRIKSMPNIYFSTTDDAKQHNYSFVETDVCPETGRVHRFGGLRGDAREFALQSHLYNTISINEFHKQNFDHVIVACGYQIRSVPIFDKTGCALVPQYTAGGTKVDANGRLFDNHRIFAFGVGAGLAPSEEVGGEPGCTRRSDGIWLYQYTVGSIIRKALKT